jgi:hypothetical protein
MHLVASSASHLEEYKGNFLYVGLLMSTKSTWFRYKVCRLMLAQLLPCCVYSEVTRFESSSGTDWDYSWFSFVRQVTHDRFSSYSPESQFYEHQHISFDRIFTVFFRPSAKGRFTLRNGAWYTLRLLRISDAIDACVKLCIQTQSSAHMSILYFQIVHLFPVVRLGPGYRPEYLFALLTL